MSQQLFFLNTKSFSHCFSVHVPDKWDYWEVDGKRVNFKISRINNPKYPEYSGFSIILLWVFCLYVWENDRT